ncbi:MAG: hypothetical protein ACK58L_19155 [Planctomycetota bacterium]
MSVFGIEISGFFQVLIVTESDVNQQTISERSDASDPVSASTAARTDVCEFQTREQIEPTAGLSTEADMQHCEQAIGSSMTRREVLASSAAGLLAIWGSSDVINAGLLVQRERPRAGTIALTNGLAYSGMCSTDSTLAPKRIGQSEVERPDQKLLLRVIDQGAREIYVNVRNSKEPVFDNAVWPTLTFKVPRKRQARKPMPQGFPVLGAFDESGLARGKIVGLPNGSVDIEAAITSINELFAEVTSMTHDWSYSIATNSLPPETLLGVITKIEGYQTESIRRLELVRMLIRADRLAEAAWLMQTVAADFPDVAAEQIEFQQSLREQIARQITSALEDRKSAGQHQLASNGARIHDRNDLTPETIVRINQLVTGYDDIFRRMNTVKAAITSLTSDVKDDKVRAEVSRISQLVVDHVDPDTIDRFAAFELLAPDRANNAAADDGRESSQELLATALSGWLMGVEETVKSLTDTVSLFEARQLILDYLNSDPEESDHRRELADRIRKLEGVGIDRVAAIVQHLPSIQPISLMNSAEANKYGEFQLEATEESAGCIGLVPPEYHETRTYPIVIAFPPEFGTMADYLAHWRASAERSGFIVAVPFWKPDDGEQNLGNEPSGLRYDASAKRHRQLLALMRKLKRGFCIDDDTVFVAGHAQGGEIAMDIVTSHPHLFAGVISVCGVSRRHLQFTVGNAISVPWYVVVGDSQAGWYEQFGPVAARLFKRDAESESYFDVIFVKHPFRGVSLYPEELDDVFEWMKRQRRKSLADKFTAKLLRSTDLDWHWLRLDALPEKFARLDESTKGDESKFIPAEVTARTTERNHLIVNTAPAGLTVFLSPDVPNIDLSKPIRIDFVRTRMSVDYAPEIPHLLEELYLTGDRIRLCYQKVQIAK